MTAEDLNNTEETLSLMEPITEVSEVFRLLPTRFRAGVASTDLVYYFSIEDEQWTVFVGPESCEVRPGKHAENADCFLKTSREIFLGTASGEYNPSLTDFIRGKIKTNNPLLLQTFKEIFAEG